jgi:hypothetical protein
VSLDLVTQLCRVPHQTTTAKRTKGNLSVNQTGSKTEIGVSLSFSIGGRHHLDGLSYGLERYWRRKI